ncbi:unnamed protein product [Closterium sp. NIES-65]|nr:unnamed protein product [Closterium sp. NIES-65]
MGSGGTSVVAQLKKNGAKVIRDAQQGRWNQECGGGPCRPGCRSRGWTNSPAIGRREAGQSSDRTNGDRWRRQNHQGTVRRSGGDHVDPPQTPAASSAPVAPSAANNDGPSLAATPAPAGTSAAKVDAVDAAANRAGPSAPKANALREMLSRMETHRQDVQQPPVVGEGGGGGGEKEKEEEEKEKEEEEEKVEAEVGEEEKEKEKEEEKEEKEEEEEELEEEEAATEEEKVKVKERKGHGIRHDTTGDKQGWVGEIKVVGNESRYIGKSRDKMELTYLHSIVYLLYDGYVSKILMAELTGLEETVMKQWRAVWKEVRFLPTGMWTVIWGHGARSSQRHGKSDKRRPSYDVDVGVPNGQFRVIA